MSVSREQTDLLQRVNRASNELESLIAIERKKLDELSELRRLLKLIDIDCREVRHDAFAFKSNRLKQVEAINEIRSKHQSQSIVVLGVERMLTELTSAMNDRNQQIHAFDNIRKITRRTLSSTSVELARTKVHLSRSDSSCGDLFRSIGDRNATIRRDGDAHERALEDHQKLVAERDVVASCMIRRNDELAFLTEEERSLDAGILERDTEMDQLECESANILKECDRIRVERHQLESSNLSRADLGSAIDSLGLRLLSARNRSVPQPQHRRISAAQLSDPAVDRIRLLNQFEHATDLLISLDVKVESLTHVHGC